MKWDSSALARPVAFSGWIVLSATAATGGIRRFQIKISVAPVAKR